MITTMSEIPLMVHFSLLPDPRKERNQIYNLSDLISTSIMAVLSGADDFQTISMWAEENLAWLQSLKIFLNGSPSHDTYYRLFRTLNAQVFEERFIEWSRQIAERIPEVIAIDGKSINAARDGLYSPLHLISAFSIENQLIFGSTKSKGGIKGEIEGIKTLLQVLDVKGMTVTIDAGGCYRVIADSIQAGGGNYVFTVKNNQKHLFEELRIFFLLAMTTNTEDNGCDYWASTEHGHGRLEKREVWSYGEIKDVSQKDKWPNFQSVTCIRRTVQNINSKRSTEMIRFYISSHKADAKKHATFIRSHWSIENQLHWQLDMSFNEDRSRTRRDDGGYNFSILRRLCLGLLKKETSAKVGIKNKRTKVGWNKSYMLKVLQGA